MKRIKIIIGLVIISGLISAYSCKYNSQEQLKITINKFLSTIANNKYNEFRDMILNESLSMDDDFNFPLLHRLHKKSLNKDKVLNYAIIDSSNAMGQIVIKVPYFKGYDSITAISEIDLILYFGPKNLFPMNKLSKFDIEKKWNSKARRKLIGLPPLTPKQDSIKKATGKSILTKPEDW